MKTITKFAALGVVAVGLVGCAEDNDTKVMTDDTGKTAAGITPPNAAKSSQDFLEQQKQNDPMKKAGSGYQKAQ